jgi:hypothetical protein
MPALPPDVKTHLASELDSWATETQKSLEHHAEGIRHDQGRLLKTIRDHPLNTVVEPLPNPPVVQSSGSGNPPVRGRRVIL